MAEACVLRDVLTGKGKPRCHAEAERTGYRNTEVPCEDREKAKVL